MTFGSSCGKRVSKVGLVPFHPPHSVDQDTEITEASLLGSNMSCPRVEQLISTRYTRQPPGLAAEACVLWKDHHLLEQPPQAT